MILKDFSDELVALYEDADETTNSKEKVENNIATVLAATDLDTAHGLLQKANSKLAGLVKAERGRYSIYFEDLEKVYGMPTEATPGLLEFWTVIKLMVESKSEWSGGKLTGNWTHRLVNSFYKPALTEAGIFDVLQDSFKDYGFKFNNSTGIANEHACFFSGPGENTPDFESNAGTVECKPEGTKSNFHGAAYVLRYTNPYKSTEGIFWFEPNRKRNLLGFPTKGAVMAFSIKPFRENNVVILDSNRLDNLYKELCNKAAGQPQIKQGIEQDLNTLIDKVKNQLDTVNDLEKKCFVDANLSLKNAPIELKDATKQLHTLINRKAEVAKLIPEAIAGQTDFMSLYEDLSILNEAKAVNDLVNPTEEEE